MRFDLWKSYLFFVEGKKKDLVKKNQIYFVKGKKKDFVKKNQIYFEKLKKKKIWFVKYQICFENIKNEIFLKEDSYSWEKLIMHASYIEKKDFNLTLNSFFEISKTTIL